MSPGPAPQPRELKILRGNPGKRKLPPAQAIDLLERVPHAPKSLSQAAQDEWRKLAKILINMNMLAKSDLPALMLYCSSYDLCMRADAALADAVESGGVMVENVRGGLKPSPWLKIRNDAWAQMLKIMQEFGLTPSARTRVKPLAGPLSDPFQEFLNGRK